MRLVVVGGQSRNVGKTAMVCALIEAFPHLPWTAVKITQFGHGICSHSGRPCDCACDGEDWKMSEEHQRGGRKDTRRFLASGARRVLWVRARAGQLSFAVPELWRQLGDDPYVICESNSLVAFRRPDVYLSLLDPGIQDFKPSARAMLERADAVLLPPHELSAETTALVARRILV